MSEFKDEKFVPEFVFRTQYNYYRGLLLQLSSEEGKEEQKRKAINRLHYLKCYADKNGYNISNFYEVTQSINSLIGLLVFPEQAYYNNISENPEDLKKMPTLASYIIGDKKENFRNTYRCHKKAQEWLDNPVEKFSPRNIIRHFRNAAAHTRISIYPINSGGDITHIEFMDEQFNKLIKYRDRNSELWYEWKVCNKNRGIELEKEEFFLRVAVEDLEEILLEISEFVLPVYTRLETSKKATNYSEHDVYY